jgi:hypothetical protein
LHTIAYNYQALSVTENIKFLGMQLECNLTGNYVHSDNLVKTTEFNLLQAEKIITYCKFKNVKNGLFGIFLQISYGTILCGLFSAMRNVFIIQQTAIRIVLRMGPSSCREGFKELNILTVPCLYIHALMLFAVKNLHIYQTNSSVHRMNISQQNKLRIPLIRLSSIERCLLFIRYNIQPTSTK